MVPGARRGGRAHRSTQAGKGRRKYRTLQDDYHAQVGQRYGLARGEIGSRATHQAIDRARAAEARAQAAE